MRTNSFIISDIDTHSNILIGSGITNVAIKQTKFKIPKRRKCYEIGYRMIWKLKQSTLLSER